MTKAIAFAILLAGGLAATSFGQGLGLADSARTASIVPANGPSPVRSVQAPVVNLTFNAVTLTSSKTR